MVGFSWVYPTIQLPCTLSLYFICSYFFYSVFRLTPVPKGQLVAQQWHKSFRRRTRRGGPSTRRWELLKCELNGHLRRRLWFSNTMIPVLILLVNSHRIPRIIIPVAKQRYSVQKNENKQSTTMSSWRSNGDDHHQPRKGREGEVSHHFKFEW